MQPETGDSEQRATESDAGSVAEPVRRILALLGLAGDSTQRLQELCGEVERCWRAAPSPPDAAVLCELARATRSTLPSRAAAVMDLLERALPGHPAPWRPLAELLQARHLETLRRAIVLAGRLAETGATPDSRELLALVAASLEREPDLIKDDGLLEVVEGLVRTAIGGPHPVRELLLGPGQVAERRLAARMLDARGVPLDASLASTVLGAGDWRTLSPYLMFTGAHHNDLLDIARPEGGGAPVAAAVVAAEAACGEAVVRTLIAELGWSCIALGLEAKPLVGISVSGSLPLWVRPDEATMVAEASEQPCRRREVHVAIGHGGSLVGGQHGPEITGPIERFRRLNLLHATLLQDFLDVAPLTVDAARRVVDRMEDAVADFAALFTDHAPECAIVSDVFRGIRDRVLEMLASEGGPRVQSAEATRLVKAFEDPATPAEVSTLHGLKRYLHQKGLRLGPCLGGRQATPQRSVDVAVAEGDDVAVVRRIRYVDFDVGETSAGGPSAAPPVVRMLAESFAAHLLAGHRQFPHADVYCYGNEVHVYLSYRNHPAFVRIDLSPPLQGGMVDLEYFGVSAYEHDRHPAPDLPAVTAFLRELGYEVTVDGTRIHARCDKESVLDLATLCARVTALFRLTPVLMDLDWAVGSLDLDAPARAALIRSWAASFRRWGVLPLDELTTSDHRGVLTGVDTGPTGSRQRSWGGRGPLRDRFDPAPPTRLLANLQARLCELGLGPSPPKSGATRPLPGQLELESAVLRPWRDAVARGELEAGSGRPRRAPAGRFKAEHEAVVFAQSLGLGGAAATRMIRTARVVAPLERTLVFRTTGRVAGRDVQRARLGLVGDGLTIYVLRDAHGLIRLALYSRDTCLFSRRGADTEEWMCNACDDAGALAHLLRRSNYQVAGGSSDDGGFEAEVRELLRDLSERELAREPGPLPGENLVPGLAASPGRVVGRALFDFSGRAPQELAGRVLVSAAIGPDDTIALYHAAGVVSTGGGVLSHAGLIAIQFHKPALVVGGSWLADDDGTRTMLLSIPEYREQEVRVGELSVVLRSDARERPCRVREGDLLLVNATLGTLRVLGQEATTIALFDELRNLGESSRGLERAADERELLALRGRRVRCRHRLQQILHRLGDPVIARWVVREMLLGDLLSSGPGGQTDRRVVIGALLDNPGVAAIARGFVETTAGELASRLRSALAGARSTIAAASSVIEVLHPRLEVLRLADALAGAQSCLARETILAEESHDRIAALDTLAVSSLHRLREHIGDEVDRTPPRDPRVRHLLRQLDRIDRALPPPSPVRQRCIDARRRLAAADEETRQRLAARYIARPVDGGLELAPLIGAKAANLGEVGRLLGHDLVPPWFAITDAAFRATLALQPPPRALESSDLPAGTTSLAEAIAGVLDDTALSAAEHSRRIRGLWQEAELPNAVAEEVLMAYRELGAASGHDDGEVDADGPFVALRSSSREEDVEQAARAGEFDTYLFIRGERALLEHLKRTWSGLWTERAIHNRAAMRTTGHEGGGVVVQSIVWSRVSGVALTINVGAEKLREIVINVGLGLGEGVVSGCVAADFITVDKDSVGADGGLRFSYMTADKRERVVFNRSAGAGTVLTETLYHQRLRPALEYVELSELVAAVARLEAAYGYPLDVEFAWEGHRLWILQARPVATFFADLRDTAESFPLAAEDPFTNAAADSEVLR